MTQTIRPHSYAVLGHNNLPLKPHNFNFSARKGENSITVALPHAVDDIPFIVSNPHSGIFTPKGFKHKLLPDVSLRSFCNAVIFIPIGCLPMPPAMGRFI